MRKTAAVVRGLLLTVVCLFLVGYFYYVYVPLIASFQLILIPLLLLTTGLTLARVEWGALWFVFAFPLVNNLPYFFGVDETIPHAPVALVLFLAFFVAWMAKASFSGEGLKFPVRLSRPLALLAGIIVISGLVTLWRHGNFPPLLAERFRELIVNVNQVRAGGAAMSDVFNALNYLTGFLFLGILLDILGTKAEIRKWLVVLSMSTAISLAFSLGQKFVSPQWGNMPTWVGLGQLNSTFKDPNAFGAFLSAVLPLVLGMALSYRKVGRVFLWLLVMLILFIFPSIGSRSGFLAIGISLAAFWAFILGRQKATARAKILRSAAIFLVSVVIVASIYLLQGGARLFQRLGGNLETAAQPGPDFVSSIFGGKLDLWDVAGRMVLDYPFTGVGMGAYIIELPNYLQPLGRPFAATDSAENYFIQAGAELGLVGLGLILWVFFLLAQDIRERGKNSGLPERDSYVSSGIHAGLLALGVNFLFHSYIGSFEVIYIFWFLAALALRGSPLNGRKEARNGKKPWRTHGALIFMAAYAVLHLWNSTHSLSLERQTERFGWSQDFGLYEPEKDHGNFQFQWARKSAGMTVEGPGATVVVPMKVSHPDVERTPVRAKVFVADMLFRKKALVRDVIFTTPDWVAVEFPLLPPPPQKITLLFETDRDWQPRRDLGVPDSRTLALGLGEAWSKYPSDLGGKTADLLATIPDQAWEGTLGSNLTSNGRSWVNVTLEKPNPALRMWFKGHKAMGIGPLVVIRLDGRVIGKTQVLDEDWTPLILTPQVGAGQHVLSVEFTNDFHDRETGQDRNVSLGKVDVLSLH